MDSFDKVNRYFQDGEIPEFQKQEDEYLITTFENLNLNKTELALQPVVNDIVFKDTVNSGVNELERASYCNDLIKVWNENYPKGFKLCVLYGKLGLYCNLSKGGNSFDANEEVQKYRFDKAICEYWKRGYVIGEWEEKINGKRTGNLKTGKWTKDLKTGSPVKPGIGLICGEKSGICVVDIDNKMFNGKGLTGVQTFQELLNKYNKGVLVRAKFN